MTAPKPVPVTAADLGVAALERLVAACRADADDAENRAATTTDPEAAARHEGAHDAHAKAAELAAAELRTLHRQLAELRDRQDAGAAGPEPVEIPADDQVEALHEHLVNEHLIAPAGLDDLEGDLAALATFHGADHAGDHVYRAISHGIDDHQPVQDHAERIARRRRAETTATEVTR